METVSKSLKTSIIRSNITFNSVCSDLYAQLKQQLSLPKPFLWPSQSFLSRSSICKIHTKLPSSAESTEVTVPDSRAMWYETKDGTIFRFVSTHVDVCVSVFMTVTVFVRRMSSSWQQRKHKTESTLEYHISEHHNISIFARTHWVCNLTNAPTSLHTNRLTYGSTMQWLCHNLVTTPRT